MRTYTNKAIGVCVGDRLLEVKTVGGEQTYIEPGALVTETYWTNQQYGVNRIVVIPPHQTAVRAHEVMPYAEVVAYSETKDRRNPWEFTQDCLAWVGEEVVGAGVAKLMTWFLRD